MWTSGWSSTVGTWSKNNSGIQVQMMGMESRNEILPGLMRLKQFLTPKICWRRSFWESWNLWKKPTMFFGEILKPRTLSYRIISYIDLFLLGPRYLWAISTALSASAALRSHWETDLCGARGPFPHAPGGLGHGEGQKFTSEDAMLEIPGCSCLGFKSQAVHFVWYVDFPNELDPSEHPKMSEVTLERLKQLPYRRHYPMTLTKELRLKGIGSGWLRVLWQFGIWNAVACLLYWDIFCFGTPNQLPSERPQVKINQNHFSPPTAPNPYNLACHFFEHPQKISKVCDLVPILVQAFRHSHSWELSWGAAERSGRTGKW